MGYLKQNPERIQATREFCRFFADKPDPLSLVLNDLADQDEQVAWSLVAEALHQSISLISLADLIGSMAQLFPRARLWSLPAIRTSEIQALLASKPWLQGWPLQEHLLGILNSVGHWIRTRGGTPLATVHGQSTSEIWKACGDIYFMGKSSVTRPKVLSWINRIQSRSPLGLGIEMQSKPLSSGNSWPLPVSMGTRRWLKVMGPNPRLWMESHTESERLKYFQRMYQGINPGSPADVAHGLKFFLEPQGNDLLCRLSQGGCRACAFACMSPMAGLCPQRRV